MIQSKTIYSENTAKTVSNINAYLLEGENIYVSKRYSPMAIFPSMNYGSKPVDDGNLILSPQEKEDFCTKYPQYAHLIKPLKGAKEFINDLDRFCFWIDDNQLSFALSNPEIAERIERTRAFRLKSPDAGARELAKRPHQFREYFKIRSNSIIVPRHSSENRDYIPIGYFEENEQVVIPDSAFAVYDAELWLFAVLTSKMHNIWVRAVGGRLKTDYRYSATLCYNTFPFPKISAEQKDELKACKGGIGRTCRAYGDDVGRDVQSRDYACGSAFGSSGVGCRHRALLPPRTLHLRRRALGIPLQTL